MSELQLHQTTFQLNASAMSWRVLAIGFDLLDQGVLRSAQQVNNPERVQAMNLSLTL